MPKLSEIPPELRDKHKEDAIEQILNKTKSQADVARDLGVSRQAVSLWVKDYINAGNKMPKRSPRGRPKNPTLSRRQMKWLYDTLKQKKPEDFGLSPNSNSVWTAGQLAELLLREYGIKVSTHMINTCARKWKISESYIKLPKRPYIPQYEILERELDLVNDSGDAFEHWDEEAEIKKEAESDVSWEQLSKSDYESKLQKMREQGIEWESLHSPTPSHGHRTGKHRKQSAHAKPAKRKPRPKAQKNNKKKKRKK